MRSRRRQRIEYVFDLISFWYTHAW